MSPSSSPLPHGREPLPAPRFDVPFINNAPYLDLLAAHKERLESVHLCLGPHLVPDARVPGARPHGESPAQALAALPGVPAYVLLNSRFHGWDTFSGKGLDPLVKALDQLAGKGRIQGIVVADFYLLAALKRAAPSLCSGLEAVPSVNCGLDSLPKLAAMFEHLERSGFRPPSRVVLDRSLNRRLADLAALRRELARQRPNLRVLLLANEGCLPHCPFKPAHDALVALAHWAPSTERTFELNRELGCMRTFHDHPELIFRSPLIRPEDLDAYAGLCDAFKLCGRTRDPAALTRIAGAYIKQAYSGNLLELADSMEGLAQALRVDNQALPPDLVQRTGTCALDCETCGYCRDLARRFVTRLAASPFPACP